MQFSFSFFSFLEIDIFHTIYSDYSFPSCFSQIIPLSPPRQIHTLTFWLSLECKQESRNKIGTLFFFFAKLMKHRVTWAFPWESVYGACGVGWAVDPNTTNTAGIVYYPPSLRLATLFHYLRMQNVNGIGIVYFVNFVILCILAQLGIKKFFLNFLVEYCGVSSLDKEEVIMLLLARDWTSQ